MKKYRYLRQRDGVWEYSFMIAGKRYRKSCRTHVVADAIKIVEAARKAAIDGTHPEVPHHLQHDTSMGWGYRWTAMRDYDEERALNVGMDPYDIPKTIGVVWKHLARFFKQDRSITLDNVALYVNHMQQAGFANQTIKRHLWALRRGYEWARQRNTELPPLPPFPKLRAKRTGRGAGTALEVEELRKWMGRLRRGPLDLALVAVHTGLRRTELYRLTREDIRKGAHGAAAFLRLPEEKTKGKRERSIALTAEVHATLLRNLPFKEDYKGSFARAAVKADLDRKVVHLRDLRHTFASAGSPFDADGVRLVMGHTSGDANSAMYYQHNLDKRIAKLAINVAAELGLTGYFAK